MIGKPTEIPVTADYIYNLNRVNFSSALEKARSDFRWVESLNGVFVVNNHVNRSGILGFKFLRALIDGLRDVTDFVTLKDVV